MEAAITASLMAIGAGAASGLRPYLTVLFFGMVGLVTPDNAPGVFQGAVSQIPEFLSNPLVLIVCGILAVCDTFLDKIMIVNGLWETVQGFLRPIFGVFVGIQLGLEHGTAGMVTSGFLGVASSLPVALGKATLTNSLTGVPGIQWFRSLGEETVATILMVAAIVLPILAALLGLVVVAVSIFIFIKLRKLYRSTRVKFGQFRSRRFEAKELRRKQLESGERLSMADALRQAFGGLTPAVATGMAGAAGAMTRVGASAVDGAARVGTSAAGTVGRVGTNAADTLARASVSAAGGAARVGANAADSVARASVSAATWTKDSAVAASAKQAASTAENAFRTAQQRAAELASTASERARSAVNASSQRSSGEIVASAPELPAVSDLSAEGSESAGAAPVSHESSSKPSPLIDVRLPEALPSREDSGAAAGQALNNVRSQVGKFRKGISSHIAISEDVEGQPKKSALSRIKNQAGGLRRNLGAGTSAGVEPNEDHGDVGPDSLEDSANP